MYIPKAFQVEDTRVAIDFMRRHNFATVVSAGKDGLVASHIPIVVHASEGVLPVLYAHVARANPHWRHFDGQAEALVIFQGPHGYVSPSLYETHPSVPTWNYQVVHATGVPLLIDDPQAIREHVLALVEQQEAGSPTPWMPEWPDGYLEGMLRQIVAIRIDIDRIETKFKLGQNRSVNDCERMAAWFEASPDSVLRELGEVTRASLEA